MFLCQTFFVIAEVIAILTCILSALKHNLRCLKCLRTCEIVKQDSHLKHTAEATKGVFQAKTQNFGSWAIKPEAHWVCASLTGDLKIMLELKIKETTAVQPK